MVSEADSYDVLASCQLKLTLSGSRVHMTYACVCYVWQKPSSASALINAAWILFSLAILI